MAAGNFGASAKRSWFSTKHSVRWPRLLGFGPPAYSSGQAMPNAASSHVQPPAVSSGVNVEIR
jgi:hypothetical protein